MVCWTANLVFNYCASKHKIVMLPVGGIKM